VSAAHELGPVSIRLELGPSDWPAMPAQRPWFLSGVENRWTRELRAEGLDLGVMIQPRCAMPARRDRYVFAADNGCFNEATWVGEQDWLLWAGLLPADRCLFVTCRDVYRPVQATAEATWRRSEPYFETLRTLGHRPAIVCQHGADECEPLWDECERWDALFVGGDDAWKMSSAAHDCVREAQLLGKWVHVGRVNTWRRFREVADWNANSVDGTFLAYGPDANGPRLRSWLRLAWQRSESSLFPRS
jgi:hypothetical protein